MSRIIPFNLWYIYKHFNIKYLTHEEYVDTIPYCTKLYYTYIASCQRIFWTNPNLIYTVELNTYWDSDVKIIGRILFVWIKLESRFKVKGKRIEFKHSFHLCHVQRPMQSVLLHSLTIRVNSRPVRRDFGPTICHRHAAARFRSENKHNFYCRPEILEMCFRLEYGMIFAEWYFDTERSPSADISNFLIVCKIKLKWR